MRRMDGDNNGLMHGDGKSEKCKNRKCQSYNNRRKMKEKKHMSNEYGDFHKPKSNLDLSSNPVGVPVLG